ncbi:MAG: 3-oxoacyl-[acyl-carrier-protein] reductase [Treponema sp. CETP13]|nr:MAG: 3-oxoacyl-[acyl-carrier-protein] reductase [Treponema sp. CETP13]
MLLENKKALITGSSRGIGLGITKRYLEEGCEVWGLCTKDSPAKAETEAFAKEHGVAYHEIHANVAEVENLKLVIKDALKEAGGFDILVNNAGITRDGLSFRMKLEDWNSVLSINLTSAFIISQIISGDMIRKRAGSIINMASIVGLHGQGGQVNYAASKGGLIAYTKSLAKETGARGVRVNAIAPGFIETEMTAAVNEEAQKAWLETIPAKRAGKVEDVANTCVFLGSDLSTYITAQVIGVDGGMGA